MANDPIEMTEWEWERFVPLAIRRGHKYLKARKRFVEQGMKPYMAQFLFMSGCPQHVAREILDEIRKGGDDMGLGGPVIVEGQPELDFGKRYELVRVTKRDKAIAKILDGLSELGVLDSDMNGVMRFIAQQVPEIADHQSINT